MRAKNAKWFLCLLAWLSLTTGMAGAADKKTEARKHFDQAQVHYKLGRFDKALAEYSTAYKVLPLPGFLFNIGQCHRQLGNYERAVFFFQGYLREKPQARNAAMVKRLISESQAKLDKQKEEARKAAEAKRREELRRKEEARQKAELERKREEERRLAAMQEAKAREAEAIAAAEAARRAQLERESTPFYKSWWFWTIVGVAVAGAAGGTAYYLTSGTETVLPSGSLGTLDRR